MQKSHTYHAKDPTEVAGFKNPTFPALNADYQEVVGFFPALNLALKVALKSVLHLLTKVPKISPDIWDSESGASGRCVPSLRTESLRCPDSSKRVYFNDFS